MSSHLRDPEIDRLVDELNRRPGMPDADAPDAASAGGGGDLPAGIPGSPPLADSDRLLTLDGRPLAVGGAPPPHAAPAAPAAPAAASRGLSEPLPRASLEAGEALGALLAQAIHRGASDLLLLAGLPPVFRIDGRLRRGDSDPLDAEDIVRLFQAQLASHARRDIEERGAADFSLRLPAGGVARRGEGDLSPGLDAGAAGAWRFRVNLHRQRGQLAAAMRALPREIPTLASLNLPPAFAELVKPSRGLVLVSGPTGSGKSSTLAALIGEINRGRTAHVITIEDPVEYEHRSNRSLVEHVEVGRDARSFSEALRAALRQDPDVILVGEMRDLETMATAISAAETGHLVLATLHSNDAVQSVHRIVDVFPPSQQAQIRHQLALSLHAIIAQQLVPRADGRGRIPAVELMLATFPVRHHIRSDKLEKLYNEITLGRRQGMTSFEESLAQLVREGKIDLDEARVRASHPEELDTRLRG
jgi:twitching motility protein PilT